MFDTQTKLTDREAGKVKTEFEQKNINIKLRYLVGFSPTVIAAWPEVSKYKITPDTVARAAGRMEQKEFADE